MNSKKMFIFICSVFLLMASCTLVYADGETTIVSSNTTWSNVNISGTVIVEKGATLFLNSSVNIYGDLKIKGEVYNSGSLTVAGTLYCLHYGSMMSAGAGYDYGYFYNYGQTNINSMNVTTSWLDENTSGNNDATGSDLGEAYDYEISISENEEYNLEAFSDTCVVKWISSDESVVSVTSGDTELSSGNTLGSWKVYGVATAKSLGTAYVYLKAVFSDEIYTCYKINVVADNEDVNPDECEHEWFEDRVIREATVTTDGEMQYVCSKCKSVKTEIIPAGFNYEVEIGKYVTISLSAQSNTAISTIESEDSASAYALINGSTVTYTSSGVRYSKSVEIYGWKAGKTRLTIYNSYGMITGYINVTVKPEYEYVYEHIDDKHNVTVYSLYDNESISSDNENVTIIQGTKSSFSSSSSVNGVSTSRTFYRYDLSVEYSVSGQYIVNLYGSDSGLIYILDSNISDHCMTKLEAITPTCTSMGLKEGEYCYICNKIFVEQESVPALGHTVVIDNAVAATCTEEGRTEGSHCSECNLVIKAQESISAIGHNEIIDDEMVLPTCTENGKTEKIHCSLCNAILKAQEIILATGHNEVKDEGKVATCTEEGMTDGSHCSECNEIIKEQEIIQAKGHCEVVDKAVEATYSSTGLTEGSHCSVCGEIIKAQQVIPMIVSGNPFVDVPDGRWYTANVLYVYNRGAMTGLDTTHFGPDDLLTRAMTVTLLWKIEGSVPNVAKVFPDVVPTKWYGSAVAWAKTNGVVGGYTSGEKAGTFGPTDNITRQDFVKILYAYAQFKGFDTSVKSSTSYLAETDAKTVSNYAKESVNWGFENGFIGNNNPLLSPKNNITRKEAASMIARFLDKYIK